MKSRARRSTPKARPWRRRPSRWLRSPRRSRKRRRRRKRRRMRPPRPRSRPSQFRSSLPRMHPPPRPRARLRSNSPSSNQRARPSPFQPSTNRRPPRASPPRLPRPPLRRSAATAAPARRRPCPPKPARGGGISRKSTSAEDRRRLKDIAQELEVPEGMGVILRTAGAARTKTEVKRDFEYLLRLWETVRDLTLKSTAPTLVYEEGSLVKRSIRDLYNKDIDEIVVAGEDAYKEAKEFMRMLMPSHAKNVKLYHEGLPIFTRHGIESQLDAMFTPVMQLRSGGYIVLNQAEALVAIDVNSGRATREHHIEDTALKTNLEAAEEIARQLRLRDLAGLIVIDFIDMDEKRNNRAVERRLKECLRHDRARIQVGHISHFGLLEMSRQRIRSSVLESSTEKCPHCGGTGHVRSVSSVALQLLRSLEEMLLKSATHNLTVRTRSEVGLYLLNQKRAHLRGLEERFQITIVVNADPAMGGQVPFLIEKGEQVHSLDEAKALSAQPAPAIPLAADEQPFEPKEGEPEIEGAAASDE